MDKKTLLANMENYQLKPLEAVDLSQVTKIHKYYVECLILKDGKILELSGSHTMTAMRFLEVEWSDIPVYDSPIIWLIDNYKVAFVHSKTLIQANKLSMAQRQTIKRMIGKDFLSKEYKLSY